MTSDLPSRLAVLDHIYTVYGEFTDELDLACERRCADCCTRNVSLTTLEGYRMAGQIISAGQTSLMDRLQDEANRPRFQTKVTINELAELCVRGEEPPEEESDPSWGACPFLENDECPSYLDRPFGCRCMVSTRSCAETGYAEMSPFVVTVNTVFMQYIEHVDAIGYTGNLTDVLRFMMPEENRQAYRNRTLTEPPLGMVQNRPVRALMIPPKHRSRIKPILEALQKVHI